MTSAEDRAQARARLWAMASPPQPRRPRRRYYRRHFVIWMPLVVFLPFFVAAFPFLMLAWAGRIFRAIYLNPQAAAFAAYVVAVAAEVAIMMAHAAESLATQAHEAWERYEHPGEHERHDDDLDHHFPSRGRW